jgi:hypothetical protein
MKNLAKQLEKEFLKRDKEKRESIKKVDFAEAKKLDWFLQSLLPASKKNHVFDSKKELKEYLIKRLELHTAKRLDEIKKELTFNDSLGDITELTITVEWKKSSTWGSNPTAEAYVNGVGHVSSGSISGCGYDKGCTAVARVLNQVPQFRKLMFELKDKPKNYKRTSHEVFGYGSGYGVLPQFEGGVGVSCYDRIFNNIGYKFETISSGKSFDVYRVSKIK